MNGIITAIVVITIGMGPMIPPALLELQFHSLVISPAIVVANTIRANMILVNMIVAIMIVTMRVGQITVPLLRLTVSIVHCCMGSKSTWVAY